MKSREVDFSVENDFVIMVLYYVGGGKAVVSLKELPLVAAEKASQIRVLRRYVNS